LVRIDRWDLSKIFYDTRIILDHDGHDTSPMNKPEKRNDIIDIESIVHHCLHCFYTVVIIIGKSKIREEGCTLSDLDQCLSSMNIHTLFD
jgi:hypothetical protein